jgi:hypothetical protein
MIDFFAVFDPNLVLNFANIYPVWAMTIAHSEYINPQLKY